MHRYVIKRLLMLIPVIIGVSFIVFAIMDMAGGDVTAGHIHDCKNNEGHADNDWNQHEKSFYYVSMHKNPP